ncbi:hypothetical protein BC936DRAFT_141272, partial [Jimgerdemannia flammicorona]
MRRDLDIFMLSLFHTGAFFSIPMQSDIQMQRPLPEHRDSANSISTSTSYSGGQPDPDPNNLQQSEAAPSSPLRNPTFIYDNSTTDTSSEFDWEEDGDSSPDDPNDAHGAHHNTNHRHRKSQSAPVPDSRPWWRKISPLTKQLMTGVAGSCVLMGVALFVNFLVPRPSEADFADPGFANVRNNVQAWIWWGAFVWSASLLSLWVVEATPNAVDYWARWITGKRSENVKSRLEYFIALKKCTKVIVTIAWCWGTWFFMIKFPYQSVGQHQKGYTQIVTNTWISLFIASIIWFAQKLAVQIIVLERLSKAEKSPRNTRSMDFNHSRSFTPRFKDTTNHPSDSEADLPAYRSQGGTPSRRASPKHTRNVTMDLPHPSTDALEITPAQPHTTFATYPLQRTANPTQNGLSQNSDAATIRQQAHRSHTTEILHQLHRRLQEIVVTERSERRRPTHRGSNRADVDSVPYARKVARKLFTALSRDDRDHLVVDDFAPYFKDRAEAERAFTTFDRDANGDISKREMKSAVLSIYSERRALSNSLRDLSQAVGKLDAIFSIVSAIFVLFSTLLVFNVDLMKLLVPLGSFMLALTFIFGNTAKNTFESILFLFVI